MIGPGRRRHLLRHPLDCQDAAGERAITQTRLALAAEWADPDRADDELALAHQLLEPLDQRATTLLAQVAGLVRDAGTDHDVTDRATGLRTQITVAGLARLIPTLETASPTTTPSATPRTTSPPLSTACAG
ncbi:hypothetical protein ACH40E_28195 [Streptomyces acidicola]|uniref:hypothetical protein n=1 Tax=Streptomyces acidicola TaxID=2596892 RepID=UPI003792B3E2